MLARGLSNILACSIAFSAAAIAGEPQERVATVSQGSVYENVCHLEVYRKGKAKPNTGSAVLFDARFLITAGHNVLQAKTAIERIDVRCGVADAKTAPVQQSLEEWRSQRASKFTFFRAFPKSRDFGVILLKEPIETANPVRFSDVPPRGPDGSSGSRGERVCLFGYPGDTFANSYTLYEGCQRVLGPSFFRRSVKYDVQTYTGNSGGPVIRKTPTGPELLAIHVQPGSGRKADEQFQRHVRKLMKTLTAREAAREAARTP